MGWSAIICAATVFVASSGTPLNRAEGALNTWTEAALGTELGA
ncbi:hypothetical protein MGWOODY_Hyp2040 [hydrothermal vent metagenome]|uniref:Uncharacterized protein n=1 Tax=hydrothermal vent metagenome TaxID=652676 RepID=A0A160TZR8_9ZZZZ